VPGGAFFSRKEIDDEFTDTAKRAHAKGLPWMKMTVETLEGGIAKFFTPEQMDELTKLIHIKPGDIVFFSADKWTTSCTALGAVRHLAGKKLNLADPDEIAWAWVVDFPFYEQDEDTGKVDFAHNPFSMPQGGMDSLMNKNPLDILAFQYDIIANGLELSSGGVRNKDPEVMYKAFEIVGYGKEVVDKKFGHMISAFEFGAPPHCGFAPGIERLVMLLTGEDNIRAVVPFPKNQKAEEIMVGSPAEVSEEQLKELGVEIRKSDESLS
jgi:aspartyl-tRNA synthetase